MKINPKFDIGDKVYYLDYTYAFDPLRKYLKAHYGIIEDILINDSGVSYNFVWDDFDWIRESDVFKTLEEAEQLLKEIQ